jgi:mono/diheme cytochrome c family protein
MKHVRTLLFSSSLLLLAACGGDAAPSSPKATRPTSAPAAPKPPSAKTVAEAKGLYQSLCVTCHGTTGHGDGPGAGPLNPKPRSFADSAWQASVTDDHIKRAITLGGAAVGKSPAMPAQPALKGQTAVLDALVQIVRGFNAP